MEQQSKQKQDITINPIERNTAILKRIELDILIMKTDIQVIKKDLSFIKEYIEQKKERKENNWFY
tara:strand:- start:40 stop:234 length:195 start_codon:yes stop_codon:yes gene_type:complete